MRSSNIGGQAVLEGIMMKHKEEYAVAVRRPDGQIEVSKERYTGVAGKVGPLARIPFVRGIFQFIDSLVLGMRTLIFSASFYEEEEGEGQALTREEKEKQEKKEAWMMRAVAAVSVVLAVGIFMILPYFLSGFLEPLVPSYHVRTVIEGFVRIGIFILYILLISRTEDIQRTFMYHGAEHKCINCIEHGLPLTVENVRISSRQHKRCGTSFLFFVLLISIILLLLVQVESPVMRVAVRIALLPVIAGISYEVLKAAGNSDNPVIRLLSMPGLGIQRLTTKEPDDGMIEVAIQAVEAVFDWREYERENFGADRAA
ncbi:DUF1385 domain-containing protein [Mordavella massiliensis]|uniref:DUF1385 domain-containing protein n=1 Tax=Mordavella massiliensis TaxID=1871024 RepID=A0A939BGC1_9CLOT|nr:DUF1385 domain-containing protein [Mordavella massiliensis]MBM6947754.1 DUF1385 domain-containing protein [Mordavella massiliensis]